MKASVIVPVYKDFRIRNLLESLLCQSLGLGSFEVIIIDNCESPEVYNIYQEFSQKLKLTYIIELKKGSYIARNSGILKASGEILVFTDADCIATSDWLKNLIEPFVDPSIGAIGGRIIKYLPQTWVEKGTRDLAEGQKTTQKLPFLNLPFIVTANAAYRKDVVIRLGGFDEAFSSGGDVDLSWRTILLGYRIFIASDAIIYHESRKTLGEYFWQYAGYTTGHVLLFKKYYKIHKRKYYFHSYPIRGFSYILRKFIGTKLNRNSNPEFFDDKRFLLEFIMYCGILYGDIRGALKYRILYI